MKELDFWPEGDRRKMKIGFADAIQEAYPEFAAKLRESGERKRTESLGYTSGPGLKHATC